MRFVWIVLQLYFNEAGNQVGHDGLLNKLPGYGLSTNFASG